MNIGERFLAARKAAGLSQRDIAARVGLSATAISKFEKGVLVPKSSVLVKIASATGVRPEFFFRPSSLTVSIPAFRRRASLGKKAQQGLVARVRDRLERYLEIEDLVGARAPFVPSGTASPWRKPIDAEEAADRLRNDWDLGTDPITNLIEVLEDRGLKVEALDGPPRFDALTLWAEPDVPVIAVNGKLTGDRQRFSIAHELGHLMMGPSNNGETEALANRFAGAFLVPSPAVRAELGAHRTWIDLPELHLLKHKYGLSMQGWIYRGKDAGVLSEAVHARMMRWFSSQSWRKAEPGDPIPSEKPTRMLRLVSRAVTEGLISESRGAELLGVRLQDIWRDLSREHGLPEARRR